jgi:hypothetical protein
MVTDTVLRCLLLYDANKLILLIRTSDCNWTALGRSSVLAPTSNALVYYDDAQEYWIWVCLLTETPLESGMSSGRTGDCR